MEDEAYADLEVILVARVEAGQNVIPFSPEREARIEEVVHAAAGLQGEAVLAGIGDLRIDVDHADQSMSPGRPALGVAVPVNAATAGEQGVLGGFTRCEDVTAKCGDYAAFDGEPVG